MTAIERTAYPRFHDGLTDDEIMQQFTPTKDEIDFVQNYTIKRQNQVTILIMLKCVQHLGYFPPLSDVPLPIQKYLCAQLQWSDAKYPVTESKRSQVRHRQSIRQYLGLIPYNQSGETIIAEAITQATETMSDPADLINVALEILHKQNVEL